MLDDSVLAKEEKNKVCYERRFLSHRVYVNFQISLRHRVLPKHICNKVCVVNSRLKDVLILGEANLGNHAYFFFKLFFKCFSSDPIELACKIHIVLKYFFKKIVIRAILIFLRNLV